MNKQIATGKIYLGSSFSNQIQQARVEKAKKLLAQNPTVLHVHFPFDDNFVDPKEKILKLVVQEAWPGN